MAAQHWGDDLEIVNFSDVPHAAEHFSLGHGKSKPQHTYADPRPLNPSELEQILVTFGEID